MTNKTFIFKKIPSGTPVPGQDLTVEDRPIDLDAPAPDGGLVIEELAASFDPYLRGRMRDPTIKSYTPAFGLDGPVVNATVSRVLKSGHPDFKEGDLVVAAAPIAEYARLPASSLEGVRKINNPYGLDLAHFLGTLGMPGLTAFSSFYEIGHPKRGETIFVSSAAGAVGQVVGQIAKHEGLTVIGSVGSDEKLEFITKELGFDAGFNYKTEKPLDALKRLAPNGIDIYYDNVGGEHLSAALDTINVHGRIIGSGMISEYSVKPEERYGIKNLMHLIEKRVTYRGFIVFDPDFGPKYDQEHQQKLQKWIADGSFVAKLSITQGIDKAADGFVGMLKGENFGKAVVKIKDY